MLNQRSTARKRRFSNFLAHKKNHPTNFDFVKQHLGSVSFSRVGDAYKCQFQSKVTGRTAFAFGRNFRRAYTNMIGLYQLKYEA